MGAYLVSQDGSTTIQFDVVTSENWDEDTTVTDYNVEVGADVTDNVRVSTAVCTLKCFLSNEPIQGNSFADPVLTPFNLSTPAPNQDATVSVSITVPEWDNGILLRAALMGIGDAIGGAAGGPVGSVVGGAVGGILGALLDPPGPRPTTYSPKVGLAPTPALTAQGGQTYQFQSGADFVQLALNQIRVWKDGAELLTVVGTKETVAPMVIEKFGYVADEETGTGRTVNLTLREVNIVQTVTVATPAPAVVRATLPVSAGTQATTPNANKSLAAWTADQAQSTLGGPPASSIPGASLP